VNSKTRLFVILWAAGVVGVLSFLLVDLKALLSVLPVPAGTNSARYACAKIFKFDSTDRSSVNRGSDRRDASFQSRFVVASG
jgi:hypothetical protein